MVVRTPISKGTRFTIFKRDDFTCQYCGAKPPEVVLEVDHIHPVSKGGGSGENNLITACFDCNRGKGAGTLDVAPVAIADAAALAKERAAQMRAMADAFEEEREALEMLCWDVAAVLKRDADLGFSRAQFDSIRRFMGDLGYSETMDAAMIAAARKHEGTGRFKYFCGICWRKLRGPTDE